MSSDLAASGVVPIEARPPFEQPGDETAPRPGAAALLPFAVLRPTAASRPLISPKLAPAAGFGYPTDHRYVRRFWTAAIGPGAVADLIRLAVAARRDRSLLCPVSTPLLVREGLCAIAGSALLVPETIPPLGPRHLAMLSPALRREHAHFAQPVPT